MQPVAANGLRRMAVRDIQLSNGVVIPAGVGIEMAQYSIFRNPAWGWKDPMAFVPVRPLYSLDLPPCLYGLTCWDYLSNGTLHQQLKLELRTIFNIQGIQHIAQRQIMFCSGCRSVEGGQSRCERKGKAVSFRRRARHSHTGRLDITQP